MLEKIVERRFRQLCATASVPPLAVELPSHKLLTFGASPRMTLHIKRLRGLWALTFPSLSRVGAAYVEDALDFHGDIADITDCVAQLTGADTLENEGRRRNGWLMRLLAHTRNSDKRAIEYHYDVSNAFYRLFLDQRMVYSCAYFRHADDTLDQAQLNKLDHILTKLQLKAGDRFLDVGCGWGGLIVRAAERGAQAVGVTLSQNQFDYCQKLIAEKGLQDKCEVRLQDYRDIPEAGGYDKIASVGMFEHVGLRNLPVYFKTMQALLKEEGCMLMHGITASSIDNRAVGMGGGEFIDRYVFPDGELPHVSLVMREMAAAGLEVIDAESLRRHYAQTLTHWSRRLDAHANRAVELVGDRRYRIWRAYLAGCAFGFAHQWMNVYQLLACKRANTEDNPFPLTREYMYSK